MKNRLSILYILLFVAPFTHAQEKVISSYLQFHNSMVEQRVELRGELEESNKLRVKYIKVFDNSIKNVVQTINVKEKNLVVNFPNAYITSRDFNFDGYQDLAIRYQAKKHFTTEDFSFCMLMDTTTKRLTNSVLFDDIPITNVRRNDKVIESRIILNDFSYSDREYKFVENKLILIKDVNTNYAPNGQQTTTTTHTYKNSKEFLCKKRVENRETGNYSVSNYFEVNGESYNLEVSHSGRANDIDLFKAPRFVLSMKNKEIQCLNDSIKSYSEDFQTSALTFEDVNFDGYNDVLIKQKDSRYYSCWIFNEKEKRFSFLPEFSKIQSPVFDKEKKQIISSEYVLYAHCQSSCTTSYYEINNYTLHLVNQTFSESDSNPNDPPSRKHEKLIKENLPILDKK